MESMNNFNVEPPSGYSTPMVPRPRTDLSPSTYVVGYTGLSRKYCIGIIDMVNSTDISHKLSTVQWGKYFEIFLNRIANILSTFDGFVIKNTGDGLLFYFPTDETDSKSFEKCINCCLSLTESRNKICEIFQDEGLPKVDYRISIDYGRVILMKTNTCTYIDMLGPPVNMAAKINHAADINSVVIGGDMYKMIHNLKNFVCVQKTDYVINGMELKYPIYSIRRNQ